MTSDNRAPLQQATAGEADLAAQAADGILGPNPFIGLRPADILVSLEEIGRHAVQHPTLVLEQQAALAGDLISILSGRSTLAPTQGDKRFGDAIWKENRLYRICLQGYLAWTNALRGFVDRSSLDARTKNRARFAISLVADALAPTNTLLGNPAALKKTWETRGANLLAGARNLASDMIENGGLPAQVDKTAFELGRNLAMSPGMVVFRNPVLELIQYASATESVYARPHLIVPPEINKFYVFDLSPGKSIVEYLVRHGVQMFAVSWRNPRAAERDWDMDTYAAALRDAIDAVREITGSPDVILHAACSGAMTAAALAGHFAARGDPSVHAMTLMVAVLGHTEGTLGLFATDDTVRAAKLASKAKGVLDGNEMNRVFAWLRPNDLVWNYWVNNYLMGNPPPVFDILYWSNDSTRLPARFHGELIDIFTQNLFLRPGALNVLGTAIDLTKVGCDKFFVAGTTDHITPWKGVYDAALAFGGRNDFVLSSSGHIQSLINPPGNPKAKFFVNSGLVSSPDDWLNGATSRAGSWWDHWRGWASERSGEMRPAPIHLGSKRHNPGVAAPGAYVLES
jgi:polyhydroxyalkanoate synthase subunit PhaC